MKLEFPVDTYNQLEKITECVYDKNYDIEDIISELKKLNTINTINTNKTFIENLKLYENDLCKFKEPSNIESLNEVTMLDEVTILTMQFIDIISNICFV